MFAKRFSACLMGLLFVRATLAQCPWHQDVPDLQASCLCAYNLGQELSVQCDQVSEFMAVELRGGQASSFHSIFLLAPQLQ